ncbi:cyclin-F-like [Lineus longissimus]|uniref:cyclin-F-like n=1 Tax=Lineus longissimus TaxID=88925 RepID=UPI002B4EC6F8
MKVIKNGGKCRYVVVSPRTASISGRGAIPAAELYRSVTTIWALPEELVLHLLRSLHIKDLLNMRSVHPAFRDLIDCSPIVWQMSCFKDTWPTLPNILHFEKAAKQGNIQALLKLGIAYLYNEGLPSDQEGKKITSNGETAAAMFCQAETLTPSTAPFTWLFIRPPWSNTGACCKECVFKNMLQYVKATNDVSVNLCVAHILKLFDDCDSGQRRLKYLSQAANQGSAIAMYDLWKSKQPLEENNKCHDKAVELQSIRELRDVGSLGEIESQLRLCQAYVRGQFGGISSSQAASFVREFVQSSKPTNIQDIYNWNRDLTNTMRYILVDWLVEVAGMKEFSTHTLHIAISVVDRFLRNHKMIRSKLQLLGVSAMVLCSRFLGRDIITIREAAWLTDNTYKYEDVVRMMGEIISTLRGKIRVVTSLDHLYIFETLASLDLRSKYLSEYVCELALLQSELGAYRQSEVAACSLLLSNLALKKESPWPAHMQEFTGFTLEDLTKCTLHIHEKCFLEGTMTDHREVELQAVKQRYSDEAFYEVSTIKMVSSDDLCSLLGVSEHSFNGLELKIRYKKHEGLIMSPSRNKGKCANQPANLSADREKSATPVMDANTELFNDSGLSGYYADKEDEGESFMECSESDESIDLASLWSEDKNIPMPSPPNFVSLSHFQPSGNNFTRIKSCASMEALSTPSTTTASSSFFSPMPSATLSRLSGPPVINIHRRTSRSRLLTPSSAISTPMETEGNRGVMGSRSDGNILCEGSSSLPSKTSMGLSGTTLFPSRSDSSVLSDRPRVLHDHSGRHNIPSCMIDNDSSRFTSKFSVGDVRPARSALRNVANTNTAGKSTMLTGTPAIKRKSSAQLGKDMKTHTRH